MNYICVALIVVISKSAGGIKKCRADSCGLPMVE